MRHAERDLWFGVGGNERPQVPRRAGSNRQPDPHSRGNRDHRRASSLMIDAANGIGIEAGIRTRVLPANSISTIGSAHAASFAVLAEAASGGAINT